MLFTKKDTPKKLNTVIENFLADSKKTTAYYYNNEQELSAFVFFGNYRLIVSRNMLSTIYSFILNGESKLIIEKDIFGATTIQKNNNISSDSLKDFLVVRKLALSQNEPKPIKISYYHDAT